MADWLEMFDGRLEVNEPFSDQQLSGIPAKRGVVLLTAAGRKPIVLMTAADIRARVRTRLSGPQEHERTKLPDLRQIARGVCWKIATGHFETDLQFLELSAAISPKKHTSQLAWKPAWFVHVDPQADYPQFARTREVFAEPGRYVGPLPNARAADRFIGAVQDVFELCRDYQCLRKSPRGQQCSYGQMGRCLRACDGSIPMEQYRQAVAKAADFAAGNWQALREELTQQIKQAANALRFEQAANMAPRLLRMAIFDSPAYAFVAPAEDFRFLVVQPGKSSRQAKLFLVDRGEIAVGPPLDYPPRQRQLQKSLSLMAAHVAPERPVGRQDRWRIGLVAHYLFSGEQRRGLMLRWASAMTAECLGQAIEDAAKLLHLKRPKPRSPRGAAGRLKSADKKTCDGEAAEKN